MKAVLAVLIAASTAAVTAAAPATAESSYWEERSREPAQLGYRAHRGGTRDHVDIRVRKRPGYAAYRRAPRSYNGPLYQSQEQVQQSVYDFSTGGAGDIDSYR
jgi:hypothetical protein